MKLLLIILSLTITTSVFSSIMTDDLGISWGMKISKIKLYIKKQLMKKYVDYYNSTPEKQDAIIRKVHKSVSEIIKNEVFFKKKSAKYDNSIYAGEFNYKNNESMLTLINNKKTYRFFMIKKRLWKLIIIIDKDDLGEKFTLSSFINHFSNKYNMKPYKIDYDKFKVDKKIPIKVYFKDTSTLLSLSYNDIYSSFILTYSSIKIMKLLKKEGFNVIVKSDINLDVNIGDDVKEYDQLLYETDYTSNKDDDETKDVFNEIDNDFKKEEIKSKKNKKNKEKKYKENKKLLP